MIRITWYAAIILLTLAALLLFWQFREAIVLFLLSLGMAAAVRPVTIFLVGRRVPAGLALAATYLVIVGAILILLFLAGRALLADIQTIANDLAFTYERITAEWPQSGTPYKEAIAQRLPSPPDLYRALASREGVAAVRTVFGVAAGFFAILANLAIVLILSMYWSADRVRFERLWLSLLQVRRREQTRDTWREVERSLGEYIRAEFVQSVLAGILLWIGYRILGVSYPALLALGGAFARLITWLGVILAVIPPFAVGLRDNIQLGLLAAVYTLVVFVFLELVIRRRFFAREGYSSLLLVLVAVTLIEAFGLVGAIFAPPVAAMLQIVFRHAVTRPSLAAAAATDGEGALTPLPIERDSDLTQLRARLAHLQERLATEEDLSVPETVSLMGRLDALVERTDTILQKNAASHRRVKVMSERPQAKHASGS